MYEPFKGLKVLDLSRYLLGAYITLYFADLGADVIKIEDTNTGDFVRRELPQRKGESYYHYALNRNKDSVALNLKDKEALECFYEMAKDADVLVENFRPGVTAKLGIDFETLHEMNPNLVYVSLSAYGQKDERSKTALHDINLVAKTGFYELNRGHIAELPPSDLAAAMVGLLGAQTALLDRERSGGAHIDVSMFDSIVWWNAMLDSRWFFFNQQLTPNLTEYPCVGYNVYKTKDGRPIAFGFYEHNFWDDFCEEIGRDDLKGAVKDTQPQNSYAYEEVEKIAASRTFNEWIEWGIDHHYSISPCLNKTEAVSYAMAANPEMLKYVNFPRFGVTIQTNTPIFANGQHNELSQAQEPDVHGGHTKEALKGIGKTDAQIKAMEKRGAIKTAKA